MVFLGHDPKGIKCDDIAANPEVLAALTRCAEKGQTIVCTYIVKLRLVGCFGPLQPPKLVPQSMIPLYFILYCSWSKYKPGRYYVDVWQEYIQYVQETKTYRNKRGNAPQRLALTMP